MSLRFFFGNVVHEPTFTYTVRGNVANVGVGIKD